MPRSPTQGKRLPKDKIDAPLGLTIQGGKIVYHGLIIPLRLVIIGEPLVPSEVRQFIVLGPVLRRLLRTQDTPLGKIAQDNPLGKMPQRLSWKVLAMRAITAAVTTISRSTQTETKGMRGGEEMEKLTISNPNLAGSPDRRK